MQANSFLYKSIEHIKECCNMEFTNTEGVLVKFILTCVTFT